MEGLGQRWWRNHGVILTRSLREFAARIGRLVVCHDKSWMNRAMDEARIDHPYEPSFILVRSRSPHQSCAPGPADWP